MERFSEGVTLGRIASLFYPEADELITRLRFFDCFSASPRLCDSAFIFSLTTPNDIAGSLALSLISQSKPILKGE